MKRTVLLFAGLLIGLTTASATETETSNQKPEHNLDIIKRYRYAQPIMFVERGVEFLIFPDGSFDFNMNTYHNNYNTYYKYNSRRSGINRTHKALNKRVKYSHNYNRGISISRDRYGKVRRIGNVYLNYGRSGKITRAGSIYINYGRSYGTLTQVGGLRVHYNHWGEIINTSGQVKRYSAYCNFCGAESCQINHFENDRHHNSHDNNHHNDEVYNNDNNYFYYKQNGKVKKHRRRKSNF